MTYHELVMEVEQQLKNLRHAAAGESEPSTKRVLWWASSGVVLLFYRLGMVEVVAGRMSFDRFKADHARFEAMTEEVRGFSA